MTASTKTAAPKTDLMSLLTLAAFVLALAMVAVRVTTLEIVRDTFDLKVAGTAVPPGPGPSTSLILDLICWLPAILILVRRAIDPQYVLRLHWSHAIMAALGLWVAASCFWSSDKFLAVIGASNWCAAMALGWAMCQLVRSWMRLRVVAALALGLTMLLAAQGMVYRLIEWPENVQVWQTIKKDIEADPQHRMDSFAIEQLDRKVRQGEMIAFYRSTNTYAAVAALCFFAGLGLLLQRARDRDDAGLPIAIGIGLVGILPVIWWTDSRTAQAGMILCGAILALAWWKRELFTKQSRLVYWLGVALVVIGAISVILIGVRTGGLLHDSLTFRWHYWVGAWKLHQSRPFLGTGWNNFGDAYLQFRLPMAAEEVKDPHNAIVKFLTETGAIGALLAIAWLLRSAWEITRPVTPRAPAATATTATTSTDQSIIPMIGSIAILFVVVRCIANLPLSLTGIEAMKLALFGLLVVIGLVLGSIRSLVGFSGDERPAPLVLLAILVGLGGFLLHSMVDFALFEPGPLMVMMLLLGSVLGVRHPSVAGRKPRTWIAIAALAIVALALVAHSLLIVGPIVVAESKASEAADLANHGRVAKAVELYRAADTSSPVDNYYYAQRAAELLQTTPGFDPKEVLALHTRAASANPDSAGPWLNLARFLRALRDPELSTPSIIDSDYQRVLTRNPNDAPLRLEYADYLLETNRRDAAVEQIKKALDYNDKLDAKEPRRLRKEREEEAKRVIAGGAPQKP